MAAEVLSGVLALSVFVARGATSSMIQGSSVSAFVWLGRTTAKWR